MRRNPLMCARFRVQSTIRQSVSPEYISRESCLHQTRREIESVCGEALNRLWRYLFGYRRPCRIRAAAAAAAQSKLLHSAYTTPFARLSRVVCASLARFSKKRGSVHACVALQERFVPERKCVLSARFKAQSAFVRARERDLMPTQRARTFVKCLVCRE
jgi:hypothetical protein